MFVLSEIILFKVLCLGIFFGWKGKSFMKPKTREITNFKYSFKVDV